VLEAHQKSAEQFLFLCWNRHAHLAVQALLESTKEYLAQRQFEEAIASLDEVSRPLRQILLPHIPTDAPSHKSHIVMCRRC